LDLTPTWTISSFQQALASCQNVIILAGAGLSTASGIRTYRLGSLWLNFDETKLAKPGDRS
ncbi:hypothetical protein C8R47DRAFT_332361, partial [Mycena vitilis]